MHEAAERRRILYGVRGQAAPETNEREVVIGISPAFGIKLFQTVAGHSPCPGAAGDDRGD